jgi:uncharacterized membrane protein YjgN (DUF898 family)
MTESPLASAAPAAAPSPAAALRRVPLAFSGTAGEYFRIWIVNLGLTILTLGIYSAWAKVRTRRYLYGHLRLDGAAFEYTADPVKILIGRLIVAAGAALYALGSSFFPPLAFAMLALLFLATPWIVVRALAFNHRHTRWRNLRFRFLGRYGEAARVYLGWPLLVVLSLGFAAPAYHARQQEFMVANSAYGATRFAFRWRFGDYFAAYVGAFFVFGLVIGAGIALAVALGGAGDAGEAGALGAALTVAASLLAYFAAFTVISVTTTNLLYGGASLPGVSFRSNLRVLEMLGLYLGNAVAIALSIGLLIPWAQIRLARYRASRLDVMASVDLDSFAHAAEEADGAGAFADEAAVAFDFDFGL